MSRFLPTIGRALRETGQVRAAAQWTRAQPMRALVL
jgi:hypothetical protein